MEGVYPIHVKPRLFHALPGPVVGCFEQAATKVEAASEKYTCKIDLEIICEFSRCFIKKPLVQIEGGSLHKSHIIQSHFEHLQIVLGI